MQLPVRLSIEKKISDILLIYTEVAEKPVAVGWGTIVGNVKKSWNNNYFCKDI